MLNLSLNDNITQEEIEKISVFITHNADLMSRENDINSIIRFYFLYLWREEVG